MILKDHIDHFIDMPVGLTEYLAKVVRMIGRAVQQEFAPRRVGLIVHGFGVPHAHFIVVPQHHEHDITSGRFAEARDGGVVFRHRRIAEVPRGELDGYAERLRDGSHRLPASCDMGSLILVKHAAPEIVQDLSPSDWTLSTGGREQCDQLAARLSPYSPTTLFSSEEPKARETAEIIGARLGLSAISSPGLEENDRSGVPFFPTQAEFRARMREFFLCPSELVLGKETADHAHARFVAAVEQRLADGAPNTPVVVTHGAVLTLLVARANGLNPFRLWSDLSFGSFVVLSAPSFALRRLVRFQRYDYTHAEERLGYAWCAA